MPKPHTRSTLPLTVALMPEGPVAEVVELAHLAEDLGYRGLRWPP